jgi:PHD/YefM family antitoxin component YafN of YafNO toxin-antitoxin module
MCYNLAKLVNWENMRMTTKVIASSEVQNNFGRILNDVTQNNTRFVVKRRNLPQAIILSLTDFEELLTNDGEQRRMASMVRELTPVYSLGEALIEEE